MNRMKTVSQSGSWLRQWFGGHGPGAAEALRALLAQICQQETALACHLAERARALRFAPHRRSLEVLAERDRRNAHAVAREIGRGTTLAAAAAPARRPGTLTATKLIRDLEETEALAALYRQASRLTSDGIHRGKLEGLAAEGARGSQTIRAILARMDSYVTDL
jgi:hypothetical protein